MVRAMAVMQNIAFGELGLFSVEGMDFSEILPMIISVLGIFVSFPLNIF